MTALVLDAGALIAVDRGNHAVLYTSDPGDLQKLCTATGFKAVVIGC
jgi:hypothetical protein